jgi:CRP/FNR family transcriptional regulator
MASHVEDALSRSPLFRSLGPEDRKRIAEVAAVRSYEKGDVVFREGEPSELLYTVVSGRVKVSKLLPHGREVILEIFGPGDPLGAVVAYEGRQYPASAMALERTLLLVVRRRAFFDLLERHPSLVRGYLVGMAQRIVELTRRIPEVAGGRVEARFARLFLKLAERMGRPGADGTRIPMPLSRQDLADMTGTTIETAIRIMSRWGKDGVVTTDRDGFVVHDRGSLERLAR